MERLHHIFERCCRANKNRPAVIIGDMIVTYQELDQKANRLARYLLQTGIGPDERVAIHLKRSVNTYVSLLAVLKIHAAFVPLDTEFPKDRKHFIMRDAAVSAVLTTSDIAETVNMEGVKTIELDKIDKDLAELSAKSIDSKRLPPAKDNLCYVIYTSGTTGLPKGVAVEHPSICNFVKVAQQIYQVRRDDRVYQGMTIAFDFSIEEIWIPLTVGAALVPGPTDCRRLGPELGEFLTKNRVTVFCCVPTLLATIENDIPSLRLLLVGGEACTPELVRRWARPGLRMLNTYGPTEATVTATWCELKPGKKVTIGRPLPSYKVTIRDETLRCVPRGASGEICISGIGVARGYLNRPDLTKKKFVQDPLNPSERIYRTGDLGRINSQGEIEYLGRMDTQVKIRGYRIEISEIESLMLTLPQIEQAVVSVWSPEDGISELVAWFTLREGGKEKEEDIVSKLAEIFRKKLPSYMIPSFIERLDKIPLLPSGKVDRSKLPKPTRKKIAMSGKTFVSPSNRLESKLAKAFAKALGMDKVSVDDDFFQDLGGHSLAAARLVSILRRDPKFSNISLADVYARPSVRLMANYLSSQSRKHTSVHKISTAKSAISFDEPKVYSNFRVWGCGLAQAALLLIYLAMLSLPGLAVFKKVLFLMEYQPERSGLAALLMCVAFACSFVTALLLPIGIKWLLVGRLHPGKYELWGWFFLRWWIVEKILQMAPIVFLSGTPLINLYARAMGAKLGQKCVLRTHLLHCMDLVDIGAGTSIGEGTHLYGYEVSENMLLLDKITIGKNCFIGANSVIMPGTTMEDESLLADQSLLPNYAKIPKGEAFSGSPARPDPKFKLEMASFLSNDATPGSLNKILLGIGFSLAIAFSIVVPIAATVPGFLCIGLVYRYLGWPWYLMAAPVSGLLFVLSLCLIVVMGKWMVLPRVRPGIYPIKSWFYIRKWLVDRLVGMSLEFCDSLYATLYLLPFLRLLGARIGKWAEISTIAHITPDLLEIDDESFIADAAHVGPACIYRNKIRIRPTKIGRRTFVGNSAFIPEGTILPNECLIGVLSVPPRGKIKSGTTWLGSPAIYLPRRQESQKFPESATFRPTKKRYIQRLCYEYFRVTLPSSLSFFAITAVTGPVISLLDTTNLVVASLGTASLLAIAGIGISCVVALIKWLLIGSYRPRVKPLWSTFVRRTELVTGLYENVVVPALFLHLTGTPFAPVVMRALGAKVGKRCYIESTFMTEFDLVEIGDDCNIGFACSLQTHLFEDRVMKMSRLNIGNRCSIGPRAVILYDSVLEDNVKLHALSLVMKGETLPSGTSWCGAPAQGEEVPKACTVDLSFLDHLYDYPQVVSASS